MNSMTNHNNAISNFLRSWDRMTGSMQNTIDISETKDKIYYSMDLPGVIQENLNVSLVRDTVDISAERKDRSTQSVVKTSFTVATDCDLNTLDAQLENGVLTISFSKIDPEKTSARKINVRSTRSNS